MAGVRAVENGFTLVRPAANGISVAVDPLGRVLARSDAFSAAEPGFVVDVPARHRPTVYGRTGDLLPVLCLFALGGLCLRARP
jgi:apolipoprotein N-acyltransferase